MGKFVYENMLLRLQTKSRILVFSIILSNFLLGLSVAQPNSGGSKTPALYLSRVETVYDLSPYAEILVDEEENLTVQQIVSKDFENKFAPIKESTRIHKVIWVRFTVVNDLSHDTNWMLKTANWDFASLFIQRGKRGFKEKKTGQSLPFSQWDVKKSYRLETLQEFLIRRGKTITLHIRLKNEGSAPSDLGVSMVNPRYFTEWDRNMRFAQGIFLGILLLIALHNLFVFFSDRDKSYIYFVFYLGSSALYWMTAQGYANELFWPDSPYWNNISQFIFYVLMVCWFIQFTKTYLGIQTHFRKWDQALTVLMAVISLPVLVRVLAGPVFNVWSLLLPLSVLVLIFVFILSIQSIQKDFHPSRYYLMANILLIIGGIAFIFTKLQIFPEFFFTTHGVQFGITLQSIFFSLGLTDRVNLMRQELAQETLERERTKVEEERRTAEDLRRIDKLKDNFLANTSHELRTPLNGIVGIAESLVEGAAGKLSKKMRNNLLMIVSSARRLSSLVNDILDFSKLKSHKLQLQKIPVDIYALTEVVLRLSRPLLIGKKLLLKNDIPRNLSPLSGDENRLQQIMHNLVGNAIKFTEVGIVSVTAKERDGSIEISISDTGIGIAGEKLQDIFESFEQVDTSAEREYGGTGLGLAVTKQIVELHGGRISVESEMGKGSTFTFTIPCSEMEVEASLEGKAVARVRDIDEIEFVPENGGLQKWDGKFRIMVVDDEPVNQQVLSNYLSFDNYHVTTALSGEEALQALQQGEKFDLILLDIMMPRMSGYEVTMSIREKYLPSELPIIMLTAKNQVSDLIEGLAAGANDYITKPFSKNELLARIRTHLNLKMINTSYARFVPLEFLRTLGRESIMEVKLGDQVQGEMTLLFSDIRSFTTLSEGMSPKENFDFLNEYLSYVIPSIRANNGFIDKYIGDAIMAMFPRQAEDALTAAIESIKQVEVYNDFRRKKSEAPISISIGLHTGMLMLGTIGDEERMEGTVISDAVNLASRLERLTKKYGASILISEDTLSNIEEPENYHYRFLGKVQVKGKQEAVSIFEFYDGEPDSIIDLKVDTQSDFEKALQYYFEREFAEAVVCFKKVLKINPQDKTANLYLKNSARFVVQGVPDGWRGVETMLTT